MHTPLGKTDVLAVAEQQLPIANSTAWSEPCRTVWVKGEGVEEATNGGGAAWLAFKMLKFNGKHIHKLRNHEDTCAG